MSILKRVTNAANTLFNIPRIYSHGDSNFNQELERMAFTTFSTWGSGNDTVDTDNAYALAITSAWVYSAIKTISDRLTSRESRLRIKRREGDYLVEQKTHPFLSLLMRPNTLMTGSFLMRYSSWWYHLRGNAYIFITTPSVGDGEPSELWPLPANLVRPIPQTLRAGKGRFQQHYVVDYEYTVNGLTEYLPGENIIHFRMPNPFDWWEGLSPLTAAMLDLELDRGQAVWQRDFFQEDNALPTALISLPVATNEGDFNRITDSLRSQLGNGQKRIFTRSGDLDIQIITQTIEQMQILDSRKFTRSSIDRVYNIPEGLLSGGLSSDSRMASEMTFARNAVQPALDHFADQLNLDVMPYYSDDVVVEAPSVIPQDVALQTQRYTIERIDRTINENREVMGLPPVTMPDAMQEYEHVLELPEAVLRVISTLQGQEMIDENPISGNMMGSLDPKRSITTELRKDTTVEQVARTADLKRWRKVALRSVRDGKNPGEYEFESAAIPVEMMKSISLSLLDAQDEDDVLDTFSFLGTPDTSEIHAINDALAKLQGERHV